MMFKLIAQNQRVESDAAGASQDFEINPSTGGHMVKVAHYQIVVKQKSSTSARLGLKLDHGPNGKDHILHSTPIVLTTLSGPNLLVGDSDTTKVVGEVLHPIVQCASTGASREWALVDVYEMRKPF